MTTAQEKADIKRERNKHAARRLRERRKARDAELETLRGVLPEEQRKGEQMQRALAEAEARATDALLKGSQLMLRLQAVEAGALAAMNQISELAARLQTAEARAVEAKNQSDQLAERLWTAEANLKENRDYTAFLECHIGSISPAVSLSTQASPQSGGGAYVPCPLAPFSP
eukprot:jgi/Astpho2/5823/fgenesh1_pg.00080_%23_72_t